MQPISGTRARQRYLAPETGQDQGRRWRIGAPPPMPGPCGFVPSGPLGVSPDPPAVPSGPRGASWIPRVPSGPFGVPPDSPREFRCP
jgi:hypothetical protein